MFTENDGTARGKYRFTAETSVFIALLAATGLVGHFASNYNALMSWLLTLALMTTVVIAAGYNIKKLFFGFLVDQRNRYSLSRLQTLVWTLIILSAFLTAVFINLHTDAVDPLAVAIPEELWVLMGISVTSLLGSPMLLNQKRESGLEGTKDSDMAEKRDEAAAAFSAKKETAGKPPHMNTDVDGKPVAMDGAIVEKLDPKNANWSDLFKGEAANNFKYLDISRIQMFYFTFILVIAYCFRLGQMFAGYANADGLGSSIESLPAISGGMLALLGISHTAYLGNKAIPARRVPDANSDGGG